VNFYCHNHQNKAFNYVNALKLAGHKETEKEIADFLLIDIDVLSRGVLIKKFHSQGKQTFLYPHTGRPILQWDGWYPPSEMVTAVFTMAQGGIDIPTRYGYNSAPIHAVGWSYTDVLEFQPCEEPKKVLFAPIHVNGNGFMTHRERSTNSKVFHKLLNTEGIDLTVRHIHPLEWNGLWVESGVDYVQGQPDQNTEDIHRADVVVSHQNMAYMAVAMGKPTLMMAEHLTPISGNTNKNVREVKSWDLYKDDLMFPLDILSGDTREMLKRACKDDHEIRSWRERFIGESFQHDKFVELVENYVRA